MAVNILCAAQKNHYKNITAGSKHIRLVRNSYNLTNDYSAPLWNPEHGTVLNIKQKAHISIVP